MSAYKAAVDQNIMLRKKIEKFKTLQSDIDEILGDTDSTSLDVDDPDFEDTLKEEDPLTWVHYQLVKIISS